MENNQAKITISLTDGKFEISGSELFVTQQIENFKHLIEKSFNDFESIPKKVKTENPINSSSKVEEIEIDTKTEESIADIHPTIFALDNGKVNIICDIPGNTDSKKTLNVALLYAYAQKSLGIDETSVEEVRAICKIHGCFDQRNFSTHIKNGNPKLYLDKGSNKNRLVTITRPGENKAKAIIKTIESNG